jgi:translation initiation factor IF-2
MAPHSVGLEFRPVANPAVKEFAEPAYESAPAREFIEQPSQPAAVERGDAPVLQQPAPAPVFAHAPAPVAQAHHEEPQQSLFRPVAPAAEYILPEIKPTAANPEPKPEPKPEAKPENPAAATSEEHQPS